MLWKLLRRSDCKHQGRCTAAALFLSYSHQKTFSRGWFWLHQRPPLTRGLDFAKQKTGGENFIFLFLSRRLRLRRTHLPHQREALRSAGVNQPNRKPKHNSNLQETARISLPSRRSAAHLPPGGRFFRCAVVTLRTAFPTMEKILASPPRNDMRNPEMQFFPLDFPGQWCYTA